MGSRVALSGSSALPTLDEKSLYRSGKKPNTDFRRSTRDAPIYNELGMTKYWRPTPQTRRQ